MICPTCKKTIPDNTLKCPYCKTRTGLVCKKCNTVNSIFDYKCKNCGNEILKLCPNCNSINPVFQIRTFHSVKTAGFNNIQNIVNTHFYNSSNIKP